VRALAESVALAYPVPVVSRAASPGQVAAALAAIPDQATEANLDRVVPVLLAQLDASPLVEESGSEARSLAAKRSEAQSRQCPAAVLGQDDLEAVVTLDQVDQERSAIRDQDDLEKEANLGQDARGVWASLDREHLENHQVRLGELDGDREERKRQGHRCNTRFRF
jgi:hypothetical protein